MRRLILWFLFLCILAMPYMTLAEAALPSGKAEITCVRSGLFVDKVVGTNVLRYVFDVTGPVEAEGFAVLGAASPRLAVVLKGAVPAKGANLAVEDELVRKTGYTVNGTDTQVFMELSRKISPSDFKVFTLPSDPKANRPFRVVVDINRNATSAAQQDREAAGGKTAIPQGPQLLQMRSYTHVDAVTGSSTLRLVIDSSVPVTATGTVSAAPLPRLIVNIKGAVPGRIERQCDFDGKIADKAIIYPDGANDSRLIVDLPLMLEPTDYKVFILPVDAKADKPFRVVVDMKQKVPPATYRFTPGLRNKVIVLDPGHGGSDPGAIGQGGLKEKTVNLAVALKTKELLEKAGAKVLMTRETDVDVYGPDASDVEELKARTTIANNRKADVFISIHSNSAVNRDISGTSTFYYQKTPYDAMLAQNLQQALLQTGGLPDRRINATNFYVNKRTIMPSALVEMAFLSNKNDEKLLGSAQFQQQMAQGIMQGLERFFAQASKQGGEQ